MASLTPKELFKYEWRVEVFLKKYKGKEKFKLTNGSSVTFVPNKKIIEAARSGDDQTIKEVGLLDTDGNHYTFGKLEKTKEFGGKGVGFGTAKEDIELQRLIDQIEELKVKEKSAVVPIRVGNKTYKVFGAATTPGTPKSDFHLVDIDGNELVWISHKDGSKPTDFQQWGGMTERVIQSHKEVQSFIKDVKEMFQSKMPRATTVARKIRSTKLKNYSVYGIDYDKQLGQQNVSILIQGPVNLRKSGASYRFQSNHIHYNGDKITNGFEPVLMAVYKGDRSNFGVTGARFGIQPIQSRKITEMI